MWSAPLSLSLTPAAVFSRLLKQLQAACGTVPDLRPVCCPDRVTLFQLSAYLRRWSVHNLGKHITCLSKEGRLTSQTSHAQPGGSRGNRLRLRPYVCFRAHPLSADEPQKEADLEQASGSADGRPPPHGVHAADPRRPAGRRQPQSQQSRL